MRHVRLRALRAAHGHARRRPRLRSPRAAAEALGGNGGGQVVAYAAASSLGAAACAARRARRRLGRGLCGLRRGLGGLGLDRLLAYAHDGMLAVAMPSGDVELLAVGEHYRRLRACCGPRAACCTWTGRATAAPADGLRPLQYWDVAAGGVLNLPTVKDVAWASWTAPLGCVQGIYPKMSDGTDIHAVHRSPDGRLLVTCDEFRKVNLFRYPCGPGSTACARPRHTGHVAAVRFTSDGKHVVSIGGPAPVHGVEGGRRQVGEEADEASGGGRHARIDERERERRSREGGRTWRSNVSCVRMYVVHRCRGCESRATLRRPWFGGASLAVPQKSFKRRVLCE